MMLLRPLVAAAVLLGASAEKVSSEECPSQLGGSCTQYSANLEPGACIKPRELFVLDGTWKPITRKQAAFTTKLNFFYVVDARHAVETFRALFVGYELHLAQGSASKVHLYKNRETLGTEGKDPYSRAVKRQAVATEIMRHWSRIPNVKNVLNLKPDDIKNLDFPQAATDLSRAPHASLFRYQTSSVSCIPFDIETIPADTNTIVGKIVDVFSKDQPTDFFQITFRAQ